MSIESPVYFPFSIQLSARGRELLNLSQPLHETAARYPRILFYRQLALAVSREKGGESAVTAARLNLYGSLLDIYRYLIDLLAGGANSGLMAKGLQLAGLDPDGQIVQETVTLFKELFPPNPHFLQLEEKRQRHPLLRELLLLHLSSLNRAVDPFRQLLDDHELASQTQYRQLAIGLLEGLSQTEPLPGIGLTLADALQAPIAVDPTSLSAQLDFIRQRWGGVIPMELLESLLTAFDILEEEQRGWSDGGSGPSQVLRFDAVAGKSGSAAAAEIYHGAGHHAGYEQHEYEAFSADADWMSNVVMLAKMTHVWLDQLSRWYKRPISRLDQVPDAELDQMAERGFTALWLIGLWERSPASQRIKQLCGNPEAHASAYSLFDYSIAADLGGEEAFHSLKKRAWQRGIRLASDMVPNHTGIYSRWLLEHPDWFIQTDYPPFPTYQFNGEDLSHDPAVTIQIEDGYWNRQDAAVVFRMIDRRDGRTRYIYHGNDGTSIPWNDTAQLNYLIPQLREAVLQTILHVARLTPIIRFDAAMTLAKKHYQRLWFPQRGLGGGIPSRAEHAMGRDQFDELFPQEFWREVVDRLALEAPDTLLLAEAFWLMEGYFVRTLGMHRVYNSAFMNMIKKEENAKYRQTIKNVLEFNPEVLKRFVNFMNNPDEKTAVEQFGSQGKYFGACVLLVTMPGLPMFGHGQVEGFHEKYGMEYRKAYWDEAVDTGLLQGHQLWIFPLVKRRWLFSGSENFALYDFFCHDGSVDENVYAYSNRVGDQRALVLYNNRYGSSAGWIRTSAAVAVKGGGDQVELKNGTLGMALAIPDDPATFVAMRELVTGLEFIRNGQELCRNGLYAELGQYQFQIFLDFRLLTDSQEQDWSALCQQLDGRGVQSVDDQLLQLRYSPLIGRFKGSISTLADPDRLHGSLKLYQAELDKLSELPLDLSGTLQQLAELQKFRTIAKTVSLLRRSAVDRRLLPLDQRHRRVAVALVLTRYLALPLGGDEPLLAYGLGHPVTAFITGSDDPARGDLQWYSMLCGAVASAWQLYAEGGSRQFVTIFESLAVRRFLQVHDDRGVTWFNKERLEELLRWLALGVCFEQAQGRHLEPVPVKGLEDLATASGYRLPIFLQMTEELLVQAG